MSEKKLVVLGIPWDVDTDGLKDYMSKFGELEDCIVMKERSSGRSRGFGYVTFATVEDAKAALSSEHFLGNRVLEVKIATPKEEMRAPSKKVTRIFVARIPPSVTEAAFRSHFEKFGEITDLYMPKDPSTKGHRGIGFITFANADSVDDLMSETHELGGSNVVVDRATPKEDDFRPVSRMPQGGGGGGGYGAYNAYVTTRYAALGAPTSYDYPGPAYGRGESARGMGKKIFVGRLPQEASVEDLRQYFGRFGRILDVYVPKDPKRSGHRGFGFVTFAEDGVADRVSRRPHEICGQQVAIDSATPVDDGGGSSGGPFMDNPEPPPYGGYGPMRAYGRMYGSLDFDDWGYGGMGRLGGMGGMGRMGGGMGGLGGSMGGGRPSRDMRYRPY
ncbi:RNA-binding protein Musashi homolog 2 isoform X1 [Cynara cardunculus var. scolymus]|uniref:RNA-binding protein Musashi homolog 2 isoform X1 n=1 Tax=Cynara cardunculus var. scolymus TaxID=59895 RepID=UPI000D626E43|nr:RNA-binding protein Musashi homolog 2 isoform X1 [Cynara cardunculus var. scolymus]XP_024975930.1 RNA-binding protein Musashi homolog 2 isoform X1 [Cynara cardunculus var. scolymus]XP_024975931.1 RNA-binding protein Musashi homolog 2 isoform X1 [Cynara cardunculus var. scolymus]XP_024975933.1 RNA-binding protein Musashi homolog 2 isoform X1 [Cynara cardunculus var. scolymus]